MGRIANLQGLIKRNQGIYVTNPINILYLTNFKDFDDKQGRVFINKDSAFLIFDTREKGQIPSIYKDINIVITGSFKDDLEKIIKKEKNKEILVESKNISLHEFDFFKDLQECILLGKAKIPPQGCTRLYTPGVGGTIKIKKTVDLIEKLREIKDQEEVKNIKKACLLTDKTFEYVKKKIKVGFTEKETEYLIQDFIRRNGGDLSFDTIIASGPNSANIHHKPADRKIKKGDPVMLDFGAKINYYMSDITRMLFIGEAKPFFKKIYSIVLEAQKLAIKDLKNGDRDSKRIDAIARNVIDREGYANNFSHSLGHSFGLEIHENPRLNPKSEDKLVQGNIVTVEPGIYIEGKGGIRIEDDILIKEKGVEILTKSPKELRNMVIK